MAIWRSLGSWLSWFPRYRRQARKAHLERELSNHLDSEVEERRAAGLSPEQADYAAHRALGNTLKIEEDVRVAWGFQWLETLVQDLRHGLRMLRKSLGQEDDWFGSRFITTLIILSAVGLVSLMIWEWRHKEPIVDVRLFKMFNFASCNLMMFVLGAVLFSSTVLLPQFLQTLMRYTAQKAGMVISMAAIVLVFLLPLVGRLAGHFQARHLLAFGWIALALGMYFSCKQLDLLISFRAAAWMRIWQYLPVGFLFVPLTMAAYVGLPESKSNAAAGLINFTRNIGQSVGTSAVTTLLARRSQYHQSVLAEYTRSHRFNAVVAGLTNRLTHVGLSMYAAQQQALARMYSLVMVQAQALSYVEIYWLLAATSTLMFLLCFVLAKNEPGKRGQVAVH